MYHLLNIKLFFLHEYSLISLLALCEHCGGNNFAIALNSLCAALHEGTKNLTQSAKTKVKS